jgi:hypothetical protein
MRHRFAATVAVIVLTFSPHAVHSCTLYLGTPPRSWREDIVDCKILLYVRPDAARQQKDGNGETDFVIEHVFKTDPALGDAKRITIPRYVEIKDPKNPPRYLFFGDVFKGKPDIYRGVIVVGPAAVEYVKGILAVKDKPRAEQLRYYFDYLEHAEKELAEDAFLEFVREPDAVLAKAACKARPDALRGWLRNEKTPKSRAGLYALLLGNCGDPDDADLLRALLEKSRKEEPPSLDSLFKAYALLKPEVAWPYAHAVARDPAESFPRRFAVLRAARFFLTERPGVVPRKALLDTFAVLLEQDDIADISVEYLRLAGRWELTGRVLALPAKRPDAPAVVRRAVLRYALQCPDPAAAKYVAEVSRTDPELVQDTLELLKLEAAPPPNKP